MMVEAPQKSQAEILDIEVTNLLHAWNAGDHHARAQVLAFAYQQVRRIAAKALRSASGATLTPTELCNEAMLKLMQAAPDYANRQHFFGVCAQAVRQVLVDGARKRLADKRGAQPTLIALQELESNVIALEQADQEFLKLDAALSALASEYPKRAQLIELVYFGGFTQIEIADSMGVSITTVERDLRVTRAWLKAVMTK
jgi:RNA polymerase sigma-70 factor, ECF subfamily